VNTQHAAQLIRAGEYQPVNSNFRVDLSRAVLGHVTVAREKSRDFASAPEISRGMIFHGAEYPIGMETSLDAGRISLPDVSVPGRGGTNYFAISALASFRR